MADTADIKLAAAMDDITQRLGIEGSDSPMMLIAVKDGDRLRYIACDAVGFGKPYPDFAREFFAPAYAKLTQQS